MKISNSLKNLGKTFLLAGSGWLAKSEYKRQCFKRANERPIELAFLFRIVRDRFPKRILDVGAGTTALPHLLRNCGMEVTAIDNIRDYWPAGMINRHYHVIDDDIRSTKIKGSFDLISCISVLEHIDEFDKAVKGMFSLLSTEGSLVITCPYTEDKYFPNVYELPNSAYGQNAPYKTRSFARPNLDAWLKANNAELVEVEYWCCWTGNAWTVGEQVIPPKQVSQNENHQLACFHFRRCID